MIVEVLMGVALGRYAPNDQIAEAQIVTMTDEGLVALTDDGWQLTEAGFQYLQDEGWHRMWVRTEPFDKGMRPGVFETADEAREADVRYCQIRQAQRALIKPVFVNREREEMIS